MLFNTVLFTGNANPALAQDIATHLSIGLGKAKVGALLRRRGRRRDRAERSRARHLRRPADVLADQREPDGALHHGRRAEARVGAPGDRGDPVLRLRPPGSPPALDARADLGQGRRQHARGGRRRAPADDGPARRPDPGLLQHPGRQHLRLAGAAVGPAEQALRRPGRRLARRRRRGARARARQAGRLRPGDHRQAAAEGQRLRSDARHRRDRGPQLRDHGRHDRHRRHAREGGRRAEGARREEGLCVLHARRLLGAGDRAHPGVQARRGRHHRHDPARRRRQEVREGAPALGRLPVRRDDPPHLGRRVGHVPLRRSRIRTLSVNEAPGRGPSLLECS